MPNRKIKHIVAKLVGASTEETLDVYDVDAVHTSDVANNLTTTSEGYVLDARQGKALNDSLQRFEIEKSVFGYESSTTRMFLRYITSTATNSGHQVNFNDSGTIDFWSFSNGTWTQTGASPRTGSFSYTLPAINSHADVTITQSWSYSNPYIIQIKDHNAAIPLLCTNWWLSNNILSIKVYNIHTSSASSHSVTFYCVY